MPNFWDKLNNLVRRKITRRRVPTAIPYGQTGPGFYASQVFGSKLATSIYEHNLQSTADRIARIRDYDAMDTTPIVSTALNVYADDASSYGEDGQVLTISCDNQKILEDLEYLFYDILNIDFNIYHQIRTLTKYGDKFELLNIEKGRGVTGTIALPTAEIEREEAFDGDPTSVRFRWVAQTGAAYNEFQVAHYRLMGDDNFLPYGRCLKWDSYIETPTGFKMIKDIKIGDEVYSFDTTTEKKIITTVKNTVCSGKKQIYKIKSKNNELELSEEHNIMIWDEIENKFNYKNIYDLKIGDRIAINKQTITENEIKLNKDIQSFGGINKNGYRNSLEILPENIDEDFAELIGFMLGDGWLHNNSVCIALGIDEEINQRYVDLLKKYSGKDVKFVKQVKKNRKLKHMYALVHSKMLREILILNGFSGNVYTKRIPQWIYNAKRTLQEAFVEGLINADGSVFTDKWDCKRYGIELANEYLIKDFKFLLQRMGYKTGQISTRHRKDDCFFDGKKFDRKRSYYFYFFESENKQCKKYDKSNRLTDEYILSPILSIEKTEDVEDVYDIYIDEQNHNFFANGIVVHNSVLESGRGIWKKLQLLEDAMLIYRISRAAEKRVFQIEVGNIPFDQIENYIEQQRAKIKTESIINQQTGEIDLRYRVSALTDDYWLAKRGDMMSSIETLPGGNNLNDIDDVEYIKQQLITSLGVPKAFLQFEDDLEGKSSASKVDMRFARSIQRIQKIMISEFTKIAILHLFAKEKYDESEIFDFELKMHNPSAIMELGKLEIMERRFDIYNKAVNDSKSISMTKAKKDILDMSDDDIEKERQTLIDDAKFQAKIAKLADPNAEAAPEGGGATEPTAMEKSAEEPDKLSDMLDSLEADSIGGEKNPSIQQSDSGELKTGADYDLGSNSINSSFEQDEKKDLLFESKFSKNGKLKLTDFLKQTDMEPEGDNNEE